jgi:pilus assembly protein CpaB
LGVALVASALVYRLLRTAIASAQSANTPVVVAAADLPVGAKLEEKDLRIAKLPQGELPEQVFHNISDVVGRGVVQSMTANEIVLPTKIAPENGGAGLPALIPAGMRAVSVKVNDVVSVAGFVVPGTRVDVILTGDPSRDNDPSKVITTTVLENVEVLAAGQKLQHNAQGEPQNVPVITLLVSPGDAQKLTMAASEGKIQLALRNALDVQHQTVASLREIQLYNETPAPLPVPKAAPKPVAKPAAPAPTPIPAYVVEMIRGDQREAAKF